MTTRQTERVLRRALFPVLESNGFKLDRKWKGVVAARNRGEYHDEVMSLVHWRLPRDFMVIIGVHAEPLDRFVEQLGVSGFGRDTPHAHCSLGTFEQGANPFEPGGARLRWKFEGDEPGEGLLALVASLLDSACKRLEAICDADSLADLIRDHGFTHGVLRPSPVLAAALGYAGRCKEAVQVCRAATESNESAIAENLTYAPEAPPILQAILDYCEPRV